MITIKEVLVPKSSKVRPAEIHNKKYIVIHETGNFDKGAGAENHAKYLYNLAVKNDGWVSWHYTVDDKNIIRHIPENEITWNAGDGLKDDGGNMSGISIEICVNPESNFNHALNNTAWLCAKILHERNWGIDRIKQHYDFNGKNCPMTIRSNNRWSEFIRLVQTHLNNYNKSNVLYKVQVGAFRDRENAEKQLKKVKDAGFEAFITISES